MSDEVETEEVETEEAHPEPTPVGHHVVQDNVSEPGVQHTHQVGPDGEIVHTSSHGGEKAEDDEEPDGELKLDGAAAKKEAERLGLLDKEDGEGDVESDSALVGAGRGEGDESGQGDGGGAPEE